MATCGSDLGEMSPSGMPLDIEVRWPQHPGVPNRRSLIRRAKTGLIQHVQPIPDMCSHLKAKETTKFVLFVDVLQKPYVIEVLKMLILTHPRE